MATMTQTFEPRVLETETEYDRAVETLNALLDTNPSDESAEGRLVKFLTVLVAAYDDEHYRIPDSASPQDIVAFLMEQRDMTRADLERYLGGKSRVSEFFNEKRLLSRSQMFALRDMFGVSLDALAPRAKDIAEVPEPALA
jgi:HTH-type transcriptional regulator / antitoxin HigA